MKKVAVVMFNLGGPDSRNAIRPFLLNFFMDSNIISLPIPFRCLLAWNIARKRTKKEAGESYAELGGASPLLTNSRAQAIALQDYLNGQEDKGDTEYKTFVCMRYWHPMTPQIVREVRDWGADKVVIMPLYPQFSTTTTWSSLEQWKKHCHIADYDVPTSMICCYPEDQGYVTASAKNVKETYEKAKKETGRVPRVLFSAHGLPEKIVKGGDPYQWQCEQSAAAIAKATNIENLDWDICYQSRVGPMKWIGPSTEEALEKAAADKKDVVIYPHAFTQEHVETLVEIEVEYREVAEHLGIKGFYRVPTVGDDPDFIAGLGKMVKNFEQRDDISADSGTKICPKEFGRCCMDVADQLDKCFPAASCCGNKTDKAA